MFLLLFSSQVIILMLIPARKKKNKTKRNKECKQLNEEWPVVGRIRLMSNKAGYAIAATSVGIGALFEVTRVFGQEQ